MKITIIRLVPSKRGRKKHSGLYVVVVALLLLVFVVALCECMYVFVNMRVLVD